MGLAPRVACAEHGVVVTQVPRAEPDSRLTSGFEMECAWPAAVASQKTAGGFPRIAWRTAGHIARRVAAHLESSMPCMFDGPTAIGVDETSHRKGHTYITVAVDHKRRRVAWAHDGYGKEVPGLFLRQLTDEQRASIKAVTGDGAEWIDASVKERLPNAGRVPDSFHIVSRMSDAPDQVRKRLRNRDIVSIAVARLSGHILPRRGFLLCRGGKNRFEAAADRTMRHERFFLDVA